MIKTGVYTFYSKHKKSIQDIFNFDQLALLMLSVLESRNWFKRLYLFTDNFGAEILRDHLNLPFDSVGLDMEDFMPFPYSSFWALAKIKSYSLVYEPFCHIDNDVILYNGLPENLLNAEFIAQNRYEVNWVPMTQGLGYLPLDILKGINTRTAYNAGIIGGNNWEAFQKLWELSYQTLSHIDNRKNFLFAKNAGDKYNAFLEEGFYAILNKNVTPLFSREVTEDEAVDLGYTHLAGKMKNDPYWMKRVRAKLLTRHEKEYRKLQFLCRKLSIPIQHLPE
jgi:uncharacterized protein DUF6734